jgi:hypothetical protein
MSARLPLAAALALFAAAAVASDAAAPQTQIIGGASVTSLEVPGLDGQVVVCGDTVVVATRDALRSFSVPDLKELASTPLGGVCRYLRAAKSGPVALLSTPNDPKSGTVALVTLPGLAIGAHLDLPSVDGLATEAASDRIAATYVKGDAPHLTVVDLATGKPLADWDCFKLGYGQYQRVPQDQMKNGGLGKLDGIALMGDGALIAHATDRMVRITWSGATITLAQLSQRVARRLLAASPDGRYYAVEPVEHGTPSEAAAGWAVRIYADNVFWPRLIIPLPHGPDAVAFDPAAKRIDILAENHALAVKPDGTVESDLELPRSRSSSHHGIAVGKGGVAVAHGEMLSWIAAAKAQP